MEFQTLLNRISPILKKITYKLNGHFSYFNDEDLYQEAVLYLWQEFKEDKLSDKTDSYILQGCYFYLKNYLRKAKEKLKLVSLNSFINDNEDIDLEEILHIENLNDSSDCVATKLLLETIQNINLTTREKEVLDFYLEGLTIREIAKRLGISHVMVLKIKKKLFIKLKNFFAGYQS